MPKTRNRHKIWNIFLNKNRSIQLYTHSRCTSSGTEPVWNRCNPAGLNRSHLNKTLGKFKVKSLCRIRLKSFGEALWQNRISCLSRFPIFEKFCQTNWCSKIIRFDEIASFSSIIALFLAKLLWFWLSLLFGIFDIFIGIWKGTFWWIEIFNQTFSCLKISRNSSGLAWVVTSGVWLFVPLP